MRVPLLVLLLGALLVAGCGSDDEKKAPGGEGRPTETASAAATPTPEDVAGCEKVDKPKPKTGKAARGVRPNGQLDPSKQYTAIVKTNCGEFRIALDVKRAPKTVASFNGLAEQGFYDDTTFHRIIPGFVIQGGDPKGTGMGGPGYSVVEAPPKDLQYGPGVVAMAKTGTEKAGTSGSQFFVVTGQSGLPPDYALLGKLSGGESTVQTISTTPTDPNTEQPIDPVVIESITVEAE